LADERSTDLHGNAPDQCELAVLLVDVINAFDFEGASALLPPALRAAEEIAALLRVARERGVPVIYANDNFGKWRSDFRTLLEHCLEPDSNGRRIADLLRPRQGDYFVLKPKQSAFYETSLGLLLHHLGTKRLVICGFATDKCVLFTAIDAYLRDFELWIPADCSAAESAEGAKQALGVLSAATAAKTVEWRQMKWSEAGDAALGAPRGRGAPG
jgi:nicotinamidase-related amidase